jgi:hypothetical protein
VPQNVEIAVIGANFVKGILWAIPLVEDLFDQVLMPVQSKTDGFFVRLPPGIAIHLEFHVFLRAERLHETGS